MNFLAIESSSPVLSVAVKKGSSPVQESSLEGYMTHVESLMPLIEKMLADSGLTLETIDTFLIGRGPGSFTGLRVGFATLKAFQFLQKKDCWGATSLDMMAEPIALPEGSVLATLTDAHRSKIYFRIFERQKYWTGKTPTETRDAKEVVTMIPQGAFITGNALQRYSDLLKSEKIKNRWTLLPEASWYPRAISLISLFENQKSSMIKLESPQDFIPLYFRLSEAEERKQDAAAC